MSVHGSVEVDPQILSGPLFHLCGPILQPGAVILPGNYGRVLARFGWLHAMSVREHALEEWRRVNAHEKASRLRSCYVFLSKDDALAFRGQVIPGGQAQGFEAHLLYLVRLCEPEKPHHLTHYDFVGPFGPPGFWPEIYWRPVRPMAGMTADVEQLRTHAMRAAGRGGSGMELLTESALVVEHRFDDL